MQKRKLIRVTKRDIELGWAGGSDSCPIARAIKRAKIRVNEWHSLPSKANRFWERQGDIAYGSKHDVQPRSVLKADALRILKPFSFVLKYGGE